MTEGARNPSGKIRKTSDRDNNCIGNDSTVQYAVSTLKNA